jgi:hypothetical protein
MQFRYCVELINSGAERVSLEHNHRNSMSRPRTCRMNSATTHNAAHEHPPHPGITSEHCYSTVDKREEYISGLATLRDPSDRTTRISTLYCVLAVQIRPRCCGLHV